MRFIKQMTRNLEKVKAIARESLSRSSSVSVGKHQIALTRADFSYVKEKMNKINQKLVVCIKTGKQGIKKH